MRRREREGRSRGGGGGKEREFQDSTCRDGRWSDEEETGVMEELEE